VNGRRWLQLAGAAVVAGAALAGAVWALLRDSPASRAALVAGIAVSLAAAAVGAIPLARPGAGVAGIGKAAAARLLVGLAAAGAAALWGPWDRRTLLLGFALGYAVLLVVETWVLLRLQQRERER
jgi:hypothetical protein